jgi:peptide/nickel transport system permease protein
MGLVLALLTVWWRAPGADLVPALLSGLCLAAPAAVIALVLLWMGPWIGEATRWAIALVVFPHVYRYAKNQLIATSESPHVVAAEAKGLSSWRVLWAHVFTPAAPQLAALAGISVSLAFGAAIPIEVICDSPGVGQLAWRAAMDRDLPLLVTITVLVALMTLVVNSLADLALAAWKPSSGGAAA